MESLKICIVSSDFPPNIIGGQGVYAYKLADGLCKKGHDVHVIAPVDEFEGRKWEFEVRSLSKKVKNPLHFSLLVTKTISSIREYFDILHGNGIEHSLVCLGKPKAKIEKIVTTIHNSYLQRLYYYEMRRKLIYPPLILLEMFTCRKSDRIIAVSELSKNFIVRYGISPEKVVTIYNGVDLEDFKTESYYSDSFLRKKLGIPDGKRVLLFVGRLVKNKNPKLVIDALQYDDLSQEIHCVFVGEGPEKGRLQRYAKKIGVDNRVHFIGFVKRHEMSKIYRSADVFVLPSQSEGLPLALLEAAISGLPLIATKEALGLLQLIKDSVNGYILEEKSPINLFEKIKLCIDKKHKYGESSKKILLSKGFDWATCINKHERVYKLLLSNV